MLIRLLAAFSALACVVGCSASSSDETASDETADWPETIEKTTPWPYYGFPNGTITAPHWQAPRSFACEVSVRMRREPDREFADGEGPRSEVVEELGSTCKPVGTTISIVDSPGSEYDSLVQGSCAEGYFLSASPVGKLATVRFATDEACADLEALSERSIAGGAARRLRMTVKLVAPAPDPVFELVEVEEADDGARYEVKEK